MDELNKMTIYSMGGIVAIFFAVLISVPNVMTGDSVRDLFRGTRTITGECTSARDTCAQSSFCSAKLMITQGTKLKGIYKGACIKKYTAGYLCKKDYQCQSGECVGIDKNLKLKLSAPQIGGCA